MNKNKLVILALMASMISSAQASTCTDLLKQEVENRAENNRLARNDMWMATLTIAPFAVAFPPLAIFPSVAIGYKVAAMISLKKAKTALKVYEEAQGTGGKTTKRLYRKLKKSLPNAQLSYSEFLNRIHDADLKGEGCTPGSVPNSSDVLSVIEAD